MHEKRKTIRRRLKECSHAAMTEINRIDKHMRVAIIDADLIGRRRHRFPNLVCMKLSGYHKARGDPVILKLDYDNLDEYDRVYVAKVFTDTPLETSILEKPNVVYGGTGFFYDRAEPLPDEIEHHMPDYHLYDEWARRQKETETKYYREYSIGYLTRGCFRHCPFCVNRGSSGVEVHSPLSEFYDPSRKRIALLDDNFLGSDQWRRLLTELQATGKRFSFRQGLDVRLLDDEKSELLFASKYDGNFMFAFDDWRQSSLIEMQLRLIRRHTDRRCQFYLFTGYDRCGSYDEQFWLSDIKELFERISLLKKYDMLAYVMRYRRVSMSPFRGIYTLISGWANQPRFYLSRTVRKFANQPSRAEDLRSLKAFETEHADFSHYFDTDFKNNA